MFRLCLCESRSCYCLISLLLPLIDFVEYPHCPVPRLACLIPMCIYTSVCALAICQNVDNFSVPISLYARLFEICKRHPLFLIPSMPSPIIYLPFWFFILATCTPTMIPACPLVLLILCFQARFWPFFCLSFGNFASLSTWLPNSCLNKQHYLHSPWSASGSFLRCNSFYIMIISG